MEAQQYFKAGALTKAIEAMSAAVQKAPTDIAKRDFLQELLCFTGELERADKQLDIIAQQKPEAQFGVLQQRQLIRAEQARRQTFFEARLPEFYKEANASLLLYLKARLAIKDKDYHQAKELLEQAEHQRPVLSGQCNGIAFNDFRDINDSTAGYFEILTNNGKYYWLALEQVSSLVFFAPERPIDLLRRRALLTLSDGTEAEVHLAVMYPDTWRSKDEATLLGYQTDWLLEDNLIKLGVGQRVFMVDEEVIPIMELQNLSFS